MDIIKLFTDGSVNTKSKTGYGAYLAVRDDQRSLDDLKATVKVKRFEKTSSTKLELQTLLWALSDIPAQNGKIIIYTDSQNIIGLPGRRNRLEKNNYYSNKNRRLNNFELYQEFYRVTDCLDCEFVKVQGHKVSKQKNRIEKIFTLVDRASRIAVRENAKMFKPNN